MSAALGRPVHFDNIHVHLLPLPGLTIENFVVAESPRFGAEPVLRANLVEARLRLGSLWRRKIEISRIELQSPSVNLVHLPDGEWNFGGILTEASHLQSAPTAQQGAGDAPRFPYIEATDARLNVKQGANKLPFSITGASLALWLPSPAEWHVRLAGKPVRTDTDVSDVGELRLEGDVGRAGDLGAAPVDLQVTWKPTPMGEMAKLLVGADAGWRGDASGALEMKGLLRDAKVSADVHVRGLRRADFVPARQLDLDAHCEAEATGMLHSMHEMRCAMPMESRTSLLPSLFGRKSDRLDEEDVLTVDAELPTVLDWKTADVHASEKGSPGWVLDWIRLFTKRVPPGLTLGGTIAVDVSRQDGRWDANGSCRCELAGAGTAAKKRVWVVGAEEDGPGGLLVNAYPEDAALNPSAAVPLVPAEATAHGRLNWQGYELRYGSPALAAEAAEMFPPLGDGMPPMEQGRPVATRSWGAARTQTWTAEDAAADRHKRRR